MLFKKTTLSSLFCVILLGCAGSPVHTSKLSPEELKSVRDYTICHGAASTMHHKPHINVLNEVKRRNLDCSLIYTTPQPRRSKFDKLIHSKKLDNTWNWCKDSKGCLEAVKWMKDNISSENNLRVIKNYQLTLEKAINFKESNMKSKIGSGLTKHQKPYELELSNGTFKAQKITVEHALSLGIKDNSVVHILPKLPLIK